MNAYAQGYAVASSQAVQEAREKRRAILESVRKRRTTIYTQAHQRLRARLATQKTPL